MLFFFTHFSHRGHFKNIFMWFSHIIYLFSNAIFTRNAFIMWIKKMIHCFNVTFKNDSVIYIYLYSFIYIFHTFFYFLMWFQHVIHLIFPCDSFILTWSIHDSFTWFTPGFLRMIRLSREYDVIITRNSFFMWFSRD